MAAFNTMTIADAQGTPVNHSFVAVSAFNGIYNYQDQTSASNPLGVPVGFANVWMSGLMSKDTNAGKGKFVLDFRLIQPYLETVSNSTQSGILPAATLAYECAYFLKIVLSARSTLQNRKDLIKMGNLITAPSQTQFSDWAQSYQPPT